MSLLSGRSVMFIRNMITIPRERLGIMRFEADHDIMTAIWECNGFICSSSSPTRKSLHDLATNISESVLDLANYCACKVP